MSRLIRSLFCLILPSLLLSPLHATSSESDFFIDGRPSPAMIELLALTGIEVENSSSAVTFPQIIEKPSVSNKWHIQVSPKLSQINQLLQGNSKNNSHVEGYQWLRNSSTERWDLKKEGDPIIPSLEIAKKIATLAREKFHLYDEIQPKNNSYQGALLLGSSVWDMRRRLNFLNSILDRDIKCSHLFALTGFRSLRDDEITDLKQVPKWIHEKPDWRNNPTTLQIPKSEAEALATILYQSLTDRVEIDSVHLIHGDKEGHRATTYSTAVSWIHSNPPSGTFLIISTAPFHLYQKLTVEKAIATLGKDKDLKIEAVGPDAPTSFTTSDAPDKIFLVARTILDTIARITFEMSLISTED